MNLYLILIAFIFIYIFITGFHDEGNLIATIISSRSMSIGSAFITASLAQFIGTATLSTTVASTISKDVLRLNYLNINRDNLYIMIFTGLLGAVIWNLITWYFGMPSSSSHALVGGMIGPFIAQYGLKSVNVFGILLKVIIPLFLSPILGFLIGYLVMNTTSHLLGAAGTKVNTVLKKFQYITLFILNAGQGANDAQKGMGLISILLIGDGMSHNFTLPHWIKILSAFMISFGLLFGGLRMIKSVGTRIYRVKPFHSFNAQISSLFIVIVAAIFGLPTSGTQIINSSVLGVGAKERPTAVRWQFARGMFASWIITIPASFAISSILFLISKNI
ncbi:MAG: inorganic phosphate transporter, PiT family [Thermoanaerobacterium sp.]|uniref:inorganic phosphate transporter n=1 Tax=Thermoanaerobacterium thermosaccharolyticum TaxID=1517 RepID=UPI002651BD6C|nr:inorganic phosphate transporter, PiT family [Thermoanaerobacterium sp.]MDN5317657.1 inorganic phosphate transporter, PiT family [Thermoanaerobacterium sp.]WHE06858.1 inorganic phosphate transporter [Thermoanaerobacterium thermosaccharolyticum]